jgi:DNA-directed RNA polymerase sigma subunit (sigma70/sigma32)
MTTTEKDVRRRSRIARNITARHGEGGLLRLLDGLRAGESGQTIADDLGVSRERVRQWKLALGEEIRTYMIHPEVLRLIGSETESEKAVG